MLSSNLPQLFSFTPDLKVEGAGLPAPWLWFHFDCGTGGPEGAAGVAGAAGGEPPCNWLSRPPLPPRGGGAPGATGALWPPSRMELGLWPTPARIESVRLVR